MDSITFQFFIRLVVTKKLDIHLMDVVTTYLYGSLDSDIHIKIAEGFKMLEIYNSKPLNLYSIKLQRFLYGLK